MANVGLLYFVFIVGIEMDLTIIRRTGKKALVIALAGMALPFLIGASAAFFLTSPNKDGGVVLGPSVLGRHKNFARNVFPIRSIMVLETMANVGLLYFLFLVGVQMDLTVIRRTGKKALVITLAGMSLPFLIGASSSYFITSPNEEHKGSFFLFMGVALSVTAFPVLARILAELKLLNTELGRIAMSSAIVNDVCAWILLALSIALAENSSGTTKGGTSLASLWVILSSIAFVAFCILVIRPAVGWVIRRTPEGENFNDFYICLILTGVMICGFITDSIGTHSIFGAFVFGLVIPNGPLGTTLIEKLEDFVAGLLLPLFFAISGLRTNLRSLKLDLTWGLLMLAITLCSLAKIFGTFLAALFFQMPFREGIALGLLMNTKGLIEMIVLNVGRDQKVLTDQSFASIVVVAVVTTAIITPTVTAVYKPTKCFLPYKRRTIQSSKPDSELRLLTCIHTPRNVPTIINLLETSYPTKKSPIYLYVLHLVELTGRASAMLIVHNTHKSGRPAASRTQAQSDHIISAFENYEQLAGNVSVQPLTAISPYSTMHEDICHLAEDKRVAIIIVPFHKQQTIDGGMEATNPAFRTVNQNVLANAPCSVGILVDRGLNASSRFSSSHVTHHIVVLFFGGPDDREALAYASRMSENPNVSLTVIRFLPGEDSSRWSMQSNNDSKTYGSRSLKVVTDNDRERQLDDEFITDFRMKTANDESIIYSEKISNNGEETVAAIRSMDKTHDLYIVGRGQGLISPLTAGLTDWSECPELGAIGDILASSDFAVTVSVLVVQQYRAKMADGGGGGGGNKGMFDINGTAMDDVLVCYSPSMITTNGVWQGEDPLDYSLPLFILQLTLIVVTTRFFVFLLKPFRQPRVISEIIGGVILGPSVLGYYGKFAENVFPVRSVMVLETMANVGLLYFLFLVGVEMDLTVIRRTGRKALVIALAGMTLPFLIGASAAFFLTSDNEDKSKANDLKKQDGAKGSFFLFMGVALSVTAFPVLARILAELKLLNTELGRIAMSSAIVNDICAWILLALAIALTENDTTTKNGITDPTKGNAFSSYASLMVILSSVAFVVFCILVIRPAIGWVIRRTPEGENFNDFYICLILTGVMICGFITDSIGTHSIFGAFVFGLVIPNGQLGTTLIEKLEDFVSGLLLPLFFAISGLRTNLRSLTSDDNARRKEWSLLLVVIILCSFAKIFGTFLASLFYQMPFREGIALGLLMNTKGLIEMIVLNVGRDQKVLNDQSFAIMVIVTVVTTAIISPTVTAVYKPARRFIPYKRRTIQRSKPDSELRLLACIHTPRNVPTIINLLETTYATKKSPIYLYVLHLVELTGRASAMLIVHNTRKSGRPAANRTQAQCDHIVSAFENYEQHAGNVSVQPLTAISPYSTMHEDICNLAEDKRVALIIVPFHKQQTIDGGMEATNPAFRTVNQNVLANAPCSVGILVDRGLGASGVASSQVTHHIVVLFFGGPDDREALAYALRISQNPNASLTVIRFLPGEEASQWSMRSGNDSKTYGTGSLKVVTDNDRERQLDDEFINDFRMKAADDESVIYMEKISNNGEETVAAIRSLDKTQDLYIVGRGQEIISPLTAGLTDWSECPELGAIGDILASSDFALTVSVLVVQQYVGMGLEGDGLGTPDSPGQHHPNDNQYNIQNERYQPRGMNNNHGLRNQPWQHGEHIR
ncbi:Cation/H+ exchanger [Macleaya cordata]|uniref:Cation/H+ exchanger n=1 Tax=Macleaya cordata TaxID=56857 RepID=A0A200PSL4_MACCD|nr:Cation/H+ exchanger [Macleaya cordata]